MDDMEKLVDPSINALMEHFDVVQIFVSRSCEDGGTESFVRGAGNYYAQLGLVKLWLEKEIRRQQEFVED